MGLAPFRQLEASRAGVDLDVSDGARHFLIRANEAPLLADLTARLRYLIGCSEMEIKGRWLLMALVALATVTLAGCASTGPLSGDPCWGFFACTGWH
jgi:hypothetical protein